MTKKHDTALVKALAGDRISGSAAAAALARADTLGVDPAATICSTFGVSPTVLYARIAHYLGVGFRESAAHLVAPLEEDADLDVLSRLTTARGTIDGRPALFIAPGFSQLGTLKAAIARDPGLADRLCIVPPHALRQALADANADALLDFSVQRLARRFPGANSHLELTPALRIGFVVALYGLMALALFSPLFVQALLLPILTLILTAPSIFRIWAAATANRTSVLDTPDLLGDADLPSYSVLIPLREEAHMVPQIAEAMRRLDYPAEKLEIVFIVESASPDTVAAVREQLEDRRFSLVVVPRRAPFTKPKALNYALPLVTGEHVVVFDAEDVPERQQLRRAATLFARHPGVSCLQAELLINNGARNWITAMFTCEYAGHFAVFLPAIGRARLPMPLGGTSNHFRTRELRAIGAWDAFNVTEDADLGIRLARLGMRCARFAALTSEEAPETVMAWIKQRTRWMKGWVQTFLVHNAHPRQLLADLGWRDFLAFNVFVGGMVLSIALHGLFLIIVVARAGANLIFLGLVDLWTLAQVCILAFGYSGTAAINLIGLSRIGRQDLAPRLFLLPFYWLVGWVAVVNATLELVYKPFHWAKTHHLGLGHLLRSPARRR
ncbi:glycosyltransferase [Pelagibacterium halotolerans]|uniref:glycosyltransferase n=1 Tax=Pelagibacterium halotolerans TaxID=531813 RepID=UPI00384FB110